MTNTVQIIVSANDATSGVLRGISRQFGQLGNVVEQLTAQNVNWGNVAEAATSMVIDGMKKAINETVAYAEQVRTLSREIGATPEEASKLIQAADDVGVSYETMLTAMEGAIKKGVKPTIENIAALSDEYLKLAPGVDRTEFLIEKFGRSGAQLGPLMEMGAAGIRKAGEAAEDMGLVLNEDAIRATRQYEIAMDDLGDSAMALKVKVGTHLIPKITDLTKLMTNLISLKGDKWFKNGANAAEDFINSFFFGKKAVDNLTTSQNRSIDVTKDHGDALSETADETYDLATAQEQLEKQEKALQEAIQATTKANEGALNTVLNLENINRNYKQSVSDLRDEHDKLEEKLNTLKLKFPWDKQGIADATTALEENKKKLEEVETAYQQSVNKLVWDLFVEKLKSGPEGFSDAEYQLAIDTGVAMGIITQDTANMATQVMTNANNAAAAFANMGDTCLNTVGLLNGKVITITTRWVTEGAPAGPEIPPGFTWPPANSNIPPVIPQSDLGGGGGGVTVNRAANGGDFLIPPGYQNDTYPLGNLRLSSGEVLRVIPNGKTQERGNTYNLTINAGNVNQESVIYGYRTLQLLQEG